MEKRDYDTTTEETVTGIAICKILIPSVLYVINRDGYYSYFFLWRKERNNKSANDRLLVPVAVNVFRERY